jgi:hypothetical protein
MKFHIVTGWYSEEKERDFDNECRCGDRQPWNPTKLGAPC